MLTAPDVSHVKSEGSHLQAEQRVVVIAHRVPVRTQSEQNRAQTVRLGHLIQAKAAVHARLVQLERLAAPVQSNAPPAQQDSSPPSERPLAARARLEPYLPLPVRHHVLNALPAVSLVRMGRASVLPARPEPSQRAQGPPVALRAQRERSQLPVAHRVPCAAQVATPLKVQLPRVSLPRREDL